MIGKFMFENTVQITKRVSFDSSHALHVAKWTDEQNVDVFGKCSKFKPDGEIEPHGHTYHLEVSVIGIVDPDTGFVINFKDLKQIIKEKVLDRLDHRYINNIPYFEGKTPTAENMVQYIWLQLFPVLQTATSELTHLRLYETPDSWVDFNVGHIGKNTANDHGMF